MARLIAPDKGVRGIDVTTERGTKKYDVDRKGVINVENPKHARQMKSEGFFEASLNGATLNSENLGYTCVECGFGSWFKKCSKCGHDMSADVKTDGD